MTNDTKMLQLVLDGQSAIRKDVKEVKDEVKKVEERLTERIDRIGFQVAQLDDDAPTGEDFENLKKEVSKIQKHLALN